ncbi:pyridoxamine 5'-phosphate oxidase family protein [Streptomyces sp. JJ66]|nr:pyridoxamine 5'-phosphate oxidase family protein [Streptomyces sp. JJ66]
MQAELGSTERANRFYGDQMLDHLNERMREFTRRQEMFFLATADRQGACDSTFRAGPPGFLQVLDERTLAFPEYRGNGVHASLGNIRENPQLGILLVDFIRARIGLHINGTAEILPDADIRAAYPHLPHDPVPGRRAELWVRVSVEEAYIHCAKHIPHLMYAPKHSAQDSQDWGTDDYKRKGGDFFGAARDRAARESAGQPSGPSAPGGLDGVPAPGPARAVELAPPPASDAPPSPAAHVPGAAAPLAGDPLAGDPLGGPPSAADPVGEVPSPARSWQERAQQVLAEAEARRPDGGAASYEEWFSGRRG